MLDKKFFVGIKDTFVSFRLSDWLICASMILMFAKTFYRLSFLGWPTADYTHSYFIVPISIIIIWLKRDQLKRYDGVNASGIALFILAIFIFLFSTLNEFMFLEAASFVIMMWAIFRLRFTKESFKRIIFPLAYLFFMIPPPGLVIDTITMPLKNISAFASFKVLQLLQLPVDLRGVILKVKDHELLIADACSGFRSIVTLLSLGAVYVYFQDLSLKKKWFVFSCIVPLAVFANIFRISLTGVFSYYFGHEFAEGFFHEASGLVLFVITVLGLMWLVDVMYHLMGKKKKNDK
ncbi:MAG: exosortase/archaeosortase family protein [Candidatus Omnitrophica bacterium]|nr:exosortase/archaeosortase family protein [Candidatus Omnitrophota bacterium]